MIVLKKNLYCNHDRFIPVPERSRVNRRPIRSDFRTGSTDLGPFGTGPVKTWHKVLTGREVHPVTFLRKIVVC